MATIREINNTITITGDRQ